MSTEDCDYIPFKDGYPQLPFKDGYPQLSDVALWVTEQPGGIDNVEHILSYHGLDSLYLIERSVDWTRERMSEIYRIPDSQTAAVNEWREWSSKHTPYVDDDAARHAIDMKIEDLRTERDHISQRAFKYETANHELRHKQRVEENTQFAEDIRDGELVRLHHAIQYVRARYDEAKDEIETLKSRLSKTDSMRTEADERNELLSEALREIGRLTRNDDDDLSKSLHHIVITMLLSEGM